VLTVDVLDRYVDENGVLRSTRLVLKKGKVPKWFPDKVRSDIFILVFQWELQVTRHLYCKKKK
jgi:hypothetical protein